MTVASDAHRYRLSTVYTNQFHRVLGLQRSVVHEVTNIPPCRRLSISTLLCQCIVVNRNRNVRKTVRGCDELVRKIHNACQGMSCDKNILKCSAFNLRYFFNPWYGSQNEISDRRRLWINNYTRLVGKAMSARDQLGFWLGAYNAMVEEQNELYTSGRTGGIDTAA